MDRYKLVVSAALAVVLLGAGIFSLLSDRPWQLTAILFGLALFAGVWMTAQRVRARVADVVEVEAESVTERTPPAPSEERRAG